MRTVIGTVEAPVISIRQVVDVNGELPVPNIDVCVGGREPLVPLFNAAHGRFRQRMRNQMRSWSDEVPQWESEGHLPRQVFADLGAAGAFDRRWEAGRTGGLPYAVVLAEETAVVSAGLGLAVTLHSEVFCGLLTRLCKGDWQRSVLRDALRGQAIGCFAVTEPCGGSDVAGVATTVQRTDAGWHLTGTKRFISNAGRASHAILLAKGAGLPTGGDLCLVLVPLKNDGVRVTGFYPKLGTDACDAGHIELDVDLPADAVLGTPGLGLVHLMQALQVERIAVSAQLLVASRMCIRLAAAYMRRRKQLGRRLIDHQALRHRLADLTAMTWAAESMLGSVVLSMMRGRDMGHETAALKLTCAKAAQCVTDETMQFMGGRGYTSNYPFERAWRDIRLARIGAGTDEVMRELIGSAIDRPDTEYEELIERLMKDDLPIAEVNYRGAR